MLAAERYGPENGIAWITKAACPGDDCIRHIGFREGSRRLTVVCAPSWEDALTQFRDLIASK